MTRRVTLDAPTSATETIYETACDLLDHMRLEEKIRLIGVGVSGFDSPPHELRLPTSERTVNPTKNAAPSWTKSWTSFKTSSAKHQSCAAPLPAGGTAQKTDLILSLLRESPLSLFPFSSAHCYTLPP